MNITSLSELDPKELKNQRDRVRRERMKAEAEARRASLERHDRLTALLRRAVEESPYAEEIQALLAG